MKTYDDHLAATENAMLAGQLAIASPFGTQLAIASPFGITDEALREAAKLRVVHFSTRTFRLPPHLVELYESRRDPQPMRFSDPAL